jgi:thiamine-phosphate pyrophosphorylase
MRIFITDQQRQPEWRMIIAQLSPTDKVIIRDYAHPKRSELAMDIAKACKKRRIACAIAGDWRLAWQLNIGLHWPSSLARGKSVPVRPGQLQTMAVHNEQELARAIIHKVDYALISPVFETKTHADIKPIGPRRFMKLAMLARAGGVSPVALGGISIKNIHRLRPILGRRPNIAAIDGIDTLSSLYF